ncbi:MAG TPA: DUF4870 domain-containing protein [Bryobacteraceae bacterium]|nr:DUF4870 domain-containing protein [Bryobacteraceae bacterium]
MAFCANCGSPMEGRFCAKCGSSADAGAPPLGAAAPAGVAQPAAASGMSENGASALCYVLGLITGILFLVLAPYNQNKRVRFHAFQSIFLHIALIVVAIGMTIVFAILGHIVGLGFFIGLVLWPLFWLATLILWIYMIVSAYQGKTTVLPVIGQFAQQQA